ncbi:AmpG family muropeptide MFS transporter [Gammaproteobacteria bacterium 53_120_T64]|nr:AmpG family muropeptide MFS transporter [Gammaproteobacteria bacterium 53_120_T64]
MSSQPLRDIIFNRRMLICVFTGFASGLPLFILFQLVPAWLRTEGVGLKEIGLFTLIGLPYTWKFFWSPLLERYPLPLLGRRRGWMLLTQVGLLCCIAALPQFDTATQLWPLATLCGFIAFLSASQDIVIDAYRRELLPDIELGIGNSIHVNAYRIAGLVPGSLSLILADFLPWDTVFLITAAFMSVAIALTLSIKEPAHPSPAPATLQAAIVEPFREFFQRLGLSQALLVLCFMFLYKLGDNLATALATPFYIDMGFELSEIGIIAKHAALWPMIVGGLLGGLMMIRIGINRALWVFGVVQLLSIFGFALMAHVGEGLWLLALVIGFEYLGVGLGAAAFIAFIARTTSRLHSATQFALFTALTAVPRTVASAGTGYLVEAVGWEQFFYICALLALPGMLLLFKVAPWNGANENQASA